MGALFFFANSFYNWDRIAHRSGNSGWNSVVLRYAALGELPVPGLLLRVRFTILTWW